MKHIFLLITLAITTIACKAQTPIISLEDRNDIVPNAYYKDLDNDLNKFEGTWIYNSGTTTLTIKLEKIEQTTFAGAYYDILIGEYSYSVNGREIVNTLFDLANSAIEPYYHNIVGSRILYKGEFPGCPECDLLEKRIRLYFDDPDISREHLSSYLAIRYVDDIGIEKIEAQLVSQGTTVADQGAPTEPRVPYGDYVLVKQ